MNRALRRARAKLAGGLEYELAERFDAAAALSRAGRFEAAVAAFDALLSRDPSLAAAHVNRAAALNSLGRFDEALAAADAALRLKPDFAAAHVNRAAALNDLRRHGEAVAACEAALRLAPDFAPPHFTRGLALMALGRNGEALAAFDAAARAAPAFAAAHCNRSALLESLGRPAEAVAAAEAALALDPALAEAHANRAAALIALKRPAEALAAAEAALRLRPSFAEALATRASALVALDRADEAFAAGSAALRLNPDSPQAHAVLGAALIELGRFEAALAACEACLSGQPDHVEALKNRGVALAELGRFEAAMSAFDAALAVAPNHADARFARGLLRLLRGDFVGGWRDYESRWLAGESERRRPDFTARLPAWKGEDPAGKNILVYAEQGLGDAIQFSRCLKTLIERGARVTFFVRPAMTRLLRSLDADLQFVTPASDERQFDFQCALMSLPLALAIGLDALPAKTRFLSAEPELTAKWRARLGADGFKIGVVWQGNRTSKSDRGRSFPLAHFHGLSQIPGVRLISLQKNDGVEQLANLPAGLRIETLGADFDAGGDAFVDAAAAIEALDLVISSDTAIAHLAGALGRPVWVALKWVPDWRWRLDRSDCPWYPTMRLFRQTARDDWASVFDDIERALGELLAL